MSSAREQLESLNKQIADLTARRDALQGSADFIDSMEGKTELTVSQLADLIASYEAHKELKASEAAAVDVAEEVKEDAPLDVVAAPSPSAKV
ncbi:MAG: hypothetical protein IT366_24545 [Candidatus Hydrogenedentes bacterium]|nr:hypothetical protein [Candidatus Hydrogenedentota bacterium]